jgi:hypothetical protein
MFRIDAIKNLYPSALTIYDGGNVLDSNNEVIEIDESKVNTEIIRLQAEYVSQEYARNRKTEYDALNQLEMQYDDKANGTTTWEDAIAAIKTKYPKG